MQTNWPTCLKLVLLAEGGNDDDPDDPGGRTSRGIEQREYDAWCELNNLPKGDVWQAPQDVIDNIYHTSYWEPWCDKLPVGVDYVFFDTGVNEGPHEAILQLQRALGVTADGHIGVITLAAIAKCNPAQVINAVDDERDAFYKGLNKPKYLKGWYNRVAKVNKDALSMLTVTT